MSNREARVRRRARARRRLAFPLAIGGALLLMAVAGFWLLNPSGGGQQLALGTNNVKGPASAPVEVEEWSDFQ